MVAAATFSVPREVSANGRFPAANEVFFSPGDATFVGVRTTFGILLSHDGGSTWYWLCEDTLGLATSTEDPPIAVTAGGSLVAALSLGLTVSLDAGCGWNLVGGPLSGQVIKDVAVRPDAPHTVLAVTGTYKADAGEGGAPGFAQQVYESVDDAVHWTPLGVPIDPSARVTTLDVAASDPNRLYASAVRWTTNQQSGLSMVTEASLFVSANAGASWTERPVPFNPALAAGAASVPSDGPAIYIAAVDPNNADRVYVRSDGKSQLFVTSDAGKTWSVPLSLQTNAPWRAWRLPGNLLMPMSRIAQHADPPHRPSVERARDEVAVLARAASGDDVATRRLVREVSPYVLRVVRAVVGPRYPDTPDLVQDVLFWFLRALPSFRGESSVISFACRIAFRRALEARRRFHDVRRWMVEFQDFAHATMPNPSLPSEVAAQNLRRELLADLVAGLPKTQAEALVLRTVSGLSIEQIAEVTGCPPNTVRSRLRLAKGTLRRRIDEDPKMHDHLAGGS